MSKPRPGPEGIEFEVEGARGAWRFLNAMDGTIWILSGDAPDASGRSRCEALVTIHREGGHHRAIVKRRFGARQPFSSTSVSELVCAYFLTGSADA